MPGETAAARRLGVQFVWCLSLFETALPLKEVQVETYRQSEQSEPEAFNLDQFLPLLVLAQNVLTWFW